jgi:predicted DNA-binding transcriptional regulator YafY
VEPHHLHNVLGDWYFFAYEPEAKAIKTFHAGRVRHLHLFKRTFVRQLDFNAGKFIANGFRAESGPGAHEVAVRFDSVQSPYIRERCWHPTQELQDEPDGGVLLRLRASGLGEITRWILSYGPRAEVLSPSELRAAVATAAREMVGFYEAGGEL